MLALPVALDLSSRFFSLILGKDSKYSVFLKEWEYFKTLLTQSTVNMGNICDYLAVIQLQQDGVHLCPKSKTLTQSAKEKTRSAIRKKQRLDRLQSFAIPPESALATTHLPSLPSTPGSTSEDEFAGLLSTKQFLSESEQELPSLQVQSLNSYSEFSVTYLKSDDSLKTEKDIGTSNNLEEKKKPYTISLLKSKAYSMNRAIKTNSDTFIESWQNKQEKQNGDLRTPLRDMILYENPVSEMSHLLEQPHVPHKVRQDLSEDSFLTHAKRVNTELSQDLISSDDLRYVRSREKTKSNMEEALEQLAMKMLLNANQVVQQINTKRKLV